MDNNKGEEIIEYSTFRKVDMRVGRIIEVKQHKRAKNPSYRLRIDFGPLGIKNSGAQITDLYSEDELNGKLVIAVVNFSPKNIAGFISEVLVLGVTDENGYVVLLRPEKDSPLGSRVF